MGGFLRSTSLKTFKDTQKLAPYPSSQHVNWKYDLRARRNWRGLIDSEYFYNRRYRGVGYGERDILNRLLIMRMIDLHNWRAKMLEDETYLPETLGQTYVLAEDEADYAESTNPLFSGKNKFFAKYQWRSRYTRNYYPKWRPEPAFQFAEREAEIRRVRRKMLMPIDLYKETWGPSNASAYRPLVVQPSIPFEDVVVNKSFLQKSFGEMTKLKGLVSQFFFYSASSPDVGVGDLRSFQRFSEMVPTYFRNYPRQASSLWNKKRISRLKIPGNPELQYEKKYRNRKKVPNPGRFPLHDYFYAHRNFRRVPRVRWELLQNFPDS